MRKEMKIMRKNMTIPGLSPVHLLRNALLSAAAILSVACSTLPDESESNKEYIPEEVSFGVYLQRNRETKAGVPGILTTDSDASNKTNLEEKGFGVFGYHTDASLYNQSIKPNFMYNQNVKQNAGGSAWEYAPIKYWPNEFGEDAVSETIDRLTFFAYAPYVAVNSVTGLLSDPDDGTAENSHSTGITRLSRSTDDGDPKVSYIVSFNPANSVDLCWGVASANFTSSSGSGVAANNIAAGEPYLNVTRPKIDDSGKIKFNFKHALAALNVQIKAVVAGEAINPALTRIYVRSVSFEGFTDEGSLNLNSSVTTGPQWVNFYANGPVSSHPVTVHDGRTDGSEAISASSTEKPADLNPVIVQSKKYSETPTDGVTTTAVNLFNSNTLTDPVFVIPNDAVFKVTITYDVETRDSKILGTFLADGEEHGSVVENTITKTITGITDSKLQPGNKYTITLNLGMRSVDFSAEVSSWDSSSSETNVDLPENTTTP